MDGGATWTHGVGAEHQRRRPASKVQIPLPQAAGKAQVQVRFHYTGTWAYYWELDNVLIGNADLRPGARRPGHRPGHRRQHQGRRWPA